MIILGEIIRCFFVIRPLLYNKLYDSLLQQIGNKPKQWSLDVKH